MRVVMLGLPESGKTTFLAALWQVSLNGGVRGALRIHALSATIDYLDAIHQQWLNAEPMDHTLVEQPGNATLELKFASGQLAGELVIPDFSGEITRAYIFDRVWPTEHSAALTDADGVLLFVHPEMVKRHVPINEALLVLEGVASGLQPADEPAWHTNSVSTQGQLVELLQLFLANRFGPYLVETPSTPVRLGLIISAWDTQKKAKLKPDLWLREEMPLLTQFLGSNTAHMVHRVYGVSAQGGSFPDKSIQLRRKPKQSDRIMVETASSRSHDISGPIKWLFGQE